MHDLTLLGAVQGFGALERSVLAQIDHVLLDRERLLRRTQTRRSLYTVLGKQEQQPPPAPQPAPENSVREALISVIYPGKVRGAIGAEPSAGVALVWERLMEREVSECGFPQCRG